MSDSAWSGPVRTFTFPVEEGLVLAFRRAIGEPDDAPGMPPTFATAADHFDPAHARRPPLGRSWDGLEPDTVLHVEQTFTYHRPLRIGERLVVHKGPGRTWTKQGRTAGRLAFVEERTELRDGEGQLVVVAGWVDVRAERSHHSLTNRQLADRAPATPDRAPDGVVVAENISRTQFVMYAAAVGDYHPLHHDEQYARDHGYPSVFAPGMLTMGLTARAVTDRFGHDGLRSYTGRFRAQVWPGDTLTVSMAVGDEPEPSSEAPGTAVDVTTRNQHGAVVFEGHLVYASRV